MLGVLDARAADSVSGGFVSSNEGDPCVHQAVHIVELKTAAG